MTALQRNLFDGRIEDPDISRGHKNERSAEAHRRIEPHKAGMRARLLEHLRGRGAGGATLKELCQAFDKQPHQISGRLSELKRDGEVQETGHARSGCEVLVARCA